MVSRRELFLRVKDILRTAGIDGFGFDAKCIMEEAFGSPLPVILMDPDAKSDSSAAKRSIEMSELRAKGIPLQYIIGQWEFFGYPFKIGDGVLIPRPDTETLVEQILDICCENKLSSPKIADLCSGSGCIAVTLKKELPQAQVFAVELSEIPCGYIRENMKLNNADIQLVRGDVLSPETAGMIGGLDIIVSNPPYLTAQDMTELQTEVAHEPELALFGGNDGLDFYRQITPLWKNSLKKGGFIAYEFGLDQHDRVREILENNEFENIKFRRDSAGIIRTAAAQKRR